VQEGQCEASVPEYHKGVSKEYPNAKLPDHSVAAEHVAKELSDLTGRLAVVKVEAMNWLRDPNLYRCERYRAQARVPF
jgi:hypothetical protein